MDMLMVTEVKSKNVAGRMIWIRYTQSLDMIAESSLMAGIYAP